MTRDPMDDDPRAKYGYDMYFDRNGVPMTLRRWGLKIIDDEYKIIVQENVGMYWVSTVWMGLDMCMGFARPGEPERRPAIFETMVFLRPDTTDSLDMDLAIHRYATEEEARAGHEAVCAEIRVRTVDISRSHSRTGEKSERT